MENSKECIDELINEALKSLKNQLSLAKATIHRYKRRWQQVKEYLAANGFEMMNDEAIQYILANRFNGLKVSQILKHERRFYHAARILNDFQKNGTISIDCYLRNDPLIFEGSLAEPFNLFISTRENEDRLAATTISKIRNHLFLFYTYLIQQRIELIQDIKSATILTFLCSLDTKGKSVAKQIIYTLRKFLTYAFETKYCDYLFRVPTFKCINQATLPTIYTEDEVRKLLSTIDRRTRIGKRDYSIILLVTRIGFRASDISQLQFRNLDWDTNTITIDQYKTGAGISHPLLPDVGNAIVDYLKYARPKSDIPEVYITEKPPYTKALSAHSVSSIFRRVFKRTGIDISERKTGPHSLRHSLVSRMLEKSTALPVISAVLGHQSSESTKYYMRIDLTAMQQCMLDVPLVPIDFYTQKGGAFYG